MASRSINEVTLLGNLTRDPELKYTPAGTAVCTFSVATNRTWTTADGQTKEDVQYHRLVAWQKLAELCGKILTKGRKVWLRGRITYRDYTDKTGQQRYVTEIVVDDFIAFGDGKKSDHKDEGHKAETTSAPKQEEQHHEEHADGGPAEPASSTASLDVNPDDIPF